VRRRVLPIPFIRVDPGSRETLQAEICAAVRGAIVSGAFAPGERLPSSRALARELGVSRTTAVLALDQLFAEGYLTARYRSGTFVAQDLPDDRPPGPGPRPASPRRHPPLSRRGAQLVAARPVARSIPGMDRAFRIGTPALELFPMRAWARAVSRRLRSATTAQLGYGARTPLREAIAEHVRTRGTHCEPDQVFVTAGAQRALELMFRLLLDPGDEAWIEDPGYPGAWTALAAAGARPLPVPVDAEGLDVAAGCRTAPRARLAYVTPSHQFPLGMPMSVPRRLALLKWAKAAGAWIVEDDYDSEFRYGTRPIPCLHGLDGDGRVVYVGTFSKALFPMLRLGFVIVPPDLREAMLSLRSGATEIQPPFLDQAALADFITEGHFERHLRRMRAVYRERLEALVAAAERHGRGALRVRPVKTGLHVAADLDGADAVGVHEEAARRGVETSPLSLYAFGQAPAVNGFILGFGAASPEAIDRGMRGLSAAIEAVRRAGR
jgi:GntR family transcriptional regulator/MocR family aminotransferase